MAIVENAMENAAGNRGGAAAVIDHTHPLYLSPADTSGVALVAIQLTGTDNYALWSRSMKIALLGRSKLGFIDGSCVKEIYDGVLAAQWEKCNVVVLSWIMNVVSKELLTGIVYASNARKVWDTLKEKFDKVNIARKTFQLHREINLISQGTGLVSHYFSKLSDLWDEFDALVPPLHASVRNLSRLLIIISRQRLFQFLMGLNDSYSRARSQILMMQPVPTVNQAYALIIQEESQRTLTSAMQTLEIAETTALLGNRSSQSYRSNDSFGNKSNSSEFYGDRSSSESFQTRSWSSYKSRNQYYCDYCQKRGHSRGYCNKLKAHMRKTGSGGSYQTNTGGHNMPTANYASDGGVVSPHLHMQTSTHQAHGDFHAQNPINAGSYNGPHSQYNAGSLTGSQSSYGPVPTFTPEQCQQIMRMIGKGKEMESSAPSHTASSGPLQWEGPGDW